MGSTHQRENTLQERGYCIVYDGGDRDYVNLSKEDWRIAVDDTMPLHQKVCSLRC